MSGVSVHGALHPVMTGKSAGNVAGEIDSRERPATWQEMWMYQVQLAWKLEVQLLRLPEQNKRNPILWQPGLPGSQFRGLLA